MRILLRMTLGVMVVGMVGLGGMLIVLRQDTSQAYRVAYLSFSANDATIYHMRADGSNQTALASREQGIDRMAPTWAADGSRLAYVYAQESLFRTEIRLARLYGQRETNLITLGRNEATHPRWSPDGAWILFTNRQNNSESLHLIRPDGSDERVLMPARDGQAHHSAAWSPDSQQVAFVSREADNYTIYRIARTGGDPLNLSDQHPQLANHNLQNIVWSPDGQWLAFEANDRNEYTTYVYLLSVDGTTLRRASTTGTTQTNASWSPASDWLVLNINYGFGTATLVYAVRLADGYTQPLAISPSFIDTVRWSPLGDWLYYAQMTPDGNWDIYRSRPDGSNAHRLTHAPTAEVQPLVSPVVDLAWHPWRLGLVGLGLVGLLVLTQARFWRR